MNVKEKLCSLIFEKSKVFKNKCLEPSINCFSALLTSESFKIQTIPFIEDFIENQILTKLFPDLDDHNLKSEKKSYDNEKIMKKHSSLPLQFILLLLTKIFMWYSKCIVERYATMWPDHILSIIRQGFSSRESPCRLAAVLLVEQITRTDQINLIASKLNEWDQIIAKDLLRALKDIDSDVREKAASCMSEVSLSVWNMIPMEQKHDCIQCIVDVNQMSIGNLPVRLATISALSSMALCKAFKYDQCFLEFCIPAMLRSLEDESVVLRCRAAIAIANSLSWHHLDNSIVSNSTNTDVESIICFDEEYSSIVANTSTEKNHLATHYSSICQILSFSLFHHCKDHDKVAAPSLRAIGFLLSVLLQQNDRSIEIEKAKNILIDSISVVNTSAKVRINACNAIGEFFSNVEQREKINKLFREEKELFKKLVNLAVRDENYKVRISAIISLFKGYKFDMIPTLYLVPLVYEFIALIDKKDSRLLTTSQDKQVDKLLYLKARFLEKLFNFDEKFYNDEAIMHKIKQMMQVEIVRKNIKSILSNRIS